MSAARVLRSTLIAALLLTSLVAPAGAGDPGAAAGAGAAALGEVRALEVGASERLLVIAPHPDDETIACGGLVQRVLARGGSVDVVLLTAGDGYVRGVRGETGKAAPVAGDFVAYGERRLHEARAALDALGGARVRLTVLGFPDGNLADLLGAHWRRDDPVRSATTGAADPPYDAVAAEPALPYAGEALELELTSIVRAVRPTLIAVPDPLDVHPDHRAGGLFALRALDRWLDLAHAARPDGSTGRRARAVPPTVEPRPRVLTYLVHWPDWPPGWNDPQAGVAPATTPLALPADLPGGHGEQVALGLDAHEVLVKQRALACHATQTRQEGGYLGSFVRTAEPYTMLSLAAARAYGHASTESLWLGQPRDVARARTAAR